MKEKILSEEGHRQQMKLKELQTVAENLGCTLPQLAIGKRRLTNSDSNQPLPPQYNWLLLTLSSVPQLLSMVPQKRRGQLCAAGSFKC